MGSGSTGTLGIPLEGAVLSPDLVTLAPLQPEWVLALRQRGAADLATSVPPVEADELWRYSGIDDFDAVIFATAEANVANVADSLVALPAEAVAAGVTITVDESPTLAVDYFGTLGMAHLTESRVIRIPANVELREPIRVQTTLEIGGTAGTSWRVVVGVNSGATVIEEFRSGGGDRAPALLVASTVLELSDGARLRHASVQLLDEHDWIVASLHAITGRDATLSTVAVALGAAYARLETTAVATAKGAHSEVLAVYFAGNDQVHDFRTRQDHIAPHTTSDLLFKGAVEDRARSVYSGLIHIGKDARGTVANQTNRNLLLSAEASAESVPNLEIENNDVKCSHASAVGPIDEDHRYYLESRGVPPGDADRLIVLGFFADLLARVPDDALRNELVDAVRQKFDRRSAAEQRLSPDAS